MKCGLLGRKLGHSYSPQIHALLGNYSYQLFEKEPEEIGDFLKNGDFTGLNVTIPYKKEVIPFLDELSPAAARLGAVNTIVRRDGKLIGHNTDYFGFRRLVQESGLQVAGKKVLVLGSYEEALTRAAQAEKALLFYEHEDTVTLHQALEQGPWSTVSLLTGPEGGLEEREVSKALEAGLTVCTLGRRILRCETAPLCALSAVMYAAGEY